MFQSIFNFIKKLSPFQKEGLRLVICIIAAVLFNVIAYFGIDSEGKFLEWSKTPINLLTSTRLLSLMMYVVFPIFVYTLIKAWALNVLNEFKGVFVFIGNQITGAFYCSGLIFTSLVYHASRFEENVNNQLLTNSVVIFLSGFLYFYIFQCAIQKTLSPKLMGV